MDMSAHEDVLETVAYMLMYLKYENPNSREYGRVVIETENTDQIGDGWNYLQWRGKTRSHDAIMNLALKTVCGCNLETIPGRLDVAFFADLMAPPRDPRKRDALRIMWRSAHVIATTLRAKRKGIQSVEPDSELDILMEEKIMEAEEQKVKIEPEVESEPAGGSVAHAVQEGGTDRPPRPRPSTTPLMPTAVKAVAVASTLAKAAQGLPQSSRNYEIQVDVKEN